LKSLSGMVMLPFLFGNSSKDREKIDGRLLKKTRTLGLSSIPAIVFSKEKEEETNSCKKYLESKGVKIKYDLPFINAYAVVIEGGKLEDGARVINSTGYTGKGVGIAILDTGIYPHQDFIRPRSRIMAFKDFVNNKLSPYDDNGHGTFVAGVAAGSGYASSGKYKGIAPEANLIGVKVMDKNGSGNSSDILAGMQWVADHQKEYKIKVLSLSLGAQPSGSRLDPLAAAVEEIWRRGIVVVAAAGNAGPRQNTIATPGVSPLILTVGAVDDNRTPKYEDDKIAEFSSRGPVDRNLVKPDIVAPGVGITAPDADLEYTGSRRPEALKIPYKSMSGTSVATPVVSGAAALLVGKNPGMTPSEVKESLMKSAFQMNVSKYAQGKGILNIRKSMDI